ncbi:AAA family ATPase [Streptomyces sp. enrichment culture]|uniref:AAA family ATPase n=1 Tax=Streptomyces sp. enrichment culture TaxID=1795815 RepID=UPI003F576C04
MSTNQPPAEADLPPTRNQISGGVFFNAVIQGRDITVQLPPSITPALSGIPAVSPGFTGRDEELRKLLGLLAPGAQRRQPVLVTGLAGVGKTELAMQSAARARDEPGWFPGGVLVIDLFGYDPERRLAPEQALHNLLRALGVTGEHIPSDLQDRARLYRSVLAAFAEQGRRILVVLDNASTAQQVDSLLPTDGGTATLVTSRHILDIGAHLHELAVLDPFASTELLRDALRQARGPADTRVDDDPEAAAVVADLCAGLPLALRIAAALLADAPARPMASLTERLRQSHTRLDELSREDRAVRTALHLSYRGLDDQHARLFRLLPLSPAPICPPSPFLTSQIWTSNRPTACSRTWPGPTWSSRGTPGVAGVCMTWSGSTRTNLAAPARRRTDTPARSRVFATTTRAWPAPPRLICRAHTSPRPRLSAVAVRPSTGWTTSERTWWPPPPGASRSPISRQRS